jgi:hypothetical protein
MKNFLFTVLLALALIPAAHAQSSDWIPVTSSDGNFSILVPSQPTFNSSPGEINAQDSATGATLAKKVRFTTNLYTAKNENEVYLFGWADYEPGFTFDVQGELRANRDNFVKGLGAELVSERKISLGGNPGLEFSARKDTMYIQSRVYIFGKRPYILIAISTDPKVPRADKFFTSFNFIKR